MTEEAKKPAAEKKKPSEAHRQLTHAQKAEAAALWRSGTVSLDDLSKKFKKRKEHLSRMFTRMGVVKGSMAEETARKLVEATEARVLSDAEETMRKISATRDEHYKMAGGLAKLAWSELVRARQAGTPIDGLKDLMATLKLAGDVIGNARKELFAVLDVEKYSKQEDFEDLPELTVRELTSTEIVQLQHQTPDTLDTDPGGDMLDLDPEELE